MLCTIEDWMELCMLDKALKKSHTGQAKCLTSSHVTTKAKSSAHPFSEI